MQLNLIYDPSVDGAPSGFKVAMAAAAQFLDTLITNPITVNIEVGFGEDDNMPVSGGESTGGPSPGPGVTYAQVVQDLTDSISNATDAEAVANLPATDPTNGGLFYLSPAEEKVFGLIPANGTEIDGTVGFSADFQYYNYDPNDRAQSGLIDFVGVAEHELTHALGRVAGLQSFATDGYEVMDLFRYTAPGTPELVSDPSGYFSPSYFSIDDGTTDLGNYDTTSDPGDWSSVTGPDSFDAFSSDGVENPVTPVDTTEMNVLGFSVDTVPSTVTNYTVSTEAQLNAAIAAVQFSAADLTYVVTLAPGLPGGEPALDTALFTIDLPTGATLFIVGSGETIDGGASQAGLSVAAGSVVIENSDDRRHGSAPAARAPVAPAAAAVASPRVVGCWSRMAPRSRWPTLRSPATGRSGATVARPRTTSTAAMAVRRTMPAPSATAPRWPRPVAAMVSPARAAAAVVTNFSAPPPAAGALAASAAAAVVVATTNPRRMDPAEPAGSAAAMAEQRQEHMAAAAAVVAVG